MKKVSSLNSKSIYTGTSVHDFNEVRDILERNKISYKYKTMDLNHNSWIGERGVTRSMGGNFTDSARSLIYEILVSEKDYDEARILLSKNNK